MTLLPSFPTAPSTTAVSTTPAPAASTVSTTVIPPGSIAIFATLSGGKKSQFLEGSTISWDSAHYQFLRYVPATNMLDEFGWTTSASYAKSYIYGFTSGDWVYVDRRSSDTDRNTITRLDPKTGLTRGQFPDIYVTGDWGFSFTILGDRLIYRTRISTNLAGQRVGGGDVMAVEIGGKPIKLLDYSDPNNKGSYYAIGDELVSIVKTFDMTKPSHPQNGYDIYRVNPVTMALGEKLFSYASKEHVKFYEGDTALYWGQEDSATGDVKVIRFQLSDQPRYFATISGSNPQLCSVDDSQGKVLIVNSEDNPNRTFYYSLADPETDEIVDLDVDSSFYGGLSNGDGQFLMLS